MEITLCRYMYESEQRMTIKGGGERSDKGPQSESRVLVSVQIILCNERMPQAIGSSVDKFFNGEWEPWVRWETILTAKCKICTVLRKEQNSPFC